MNRYGHLQMQGSYGGRASKISTNRLDTLKQKTLSALRAKRLGMQKVRISPLRRRNINRYLLEMQIEYQRQKQERLLEFLANFYFLVAFAKKFHKLIIAILITIFAIYFAIHFVLTSIITREDLLAKNCYNFYYSKACREEKDEKLKNGAHYIERQKRRLTY